MKHASGDKRFKILEAHIKKFQGRQDSLIEVLHKAQELFGYLEDDLLLFVGYQLKLPQGRQASLMEVLHKAQELFGYLEDGLLLFVGYQLKLPPSRVYGVATFY